MNLNVPEGYHVELGPAEKTISMNGRDFTSVEFYELIRPQGHEGIQETAHRIARALGVGCVTVRNGKSKATVV